MSYLLRILLVLTLFLGSIDAVADEDILLEKQLDGTNVVAVAPKGWWVDTHVSSITSPAVFFTLPHPSKGAYEAGPELNVRLLNPALKIYTLSAYEKYLRKERRSNEPLKVFYFSIGKRRGFVYVEQSYRMIDFVGGTGMRVEIITETVMLQDGNQLYSCNLTTRPDKYSAYKGTAANLCKGLRFTTSSKSA